MDGISCSSGPVPVAIEAAHTGVTDGNAATQFSTMCPRSISAPRAGVRSVVTARSSIAGFIASMTARTNFFVMRPPAPGESPLGRLLPATRARRASRRPSPEDPQAGVLLAGPAGPAGQQPGEPARDDDGQRREQHGEARGTDAARLRVE